jgi:hypothetical protein
MEGFDLTERMITAAEFAAILGVTEDDVLRWMLAGRIPYTDGSEGERRVRILEEHSVDGPLTSGFTIYSISQEPDFQAEVALRRRELELKTLQHAQDELAEITTDPWPRKGCRPAPGPRAEFVLDGGAVRLLYGDLADPVLELEPMQVSEVLSKSSS